MLAFKSCLKLLNQLSVDIQNYQGPHFTRKFSSLSETCEDITLTLNTLNRNAVPNSEIEPALEKLQELKDALSDKVHANRTSCKDCQIKVQPRTRRSAESAIG